MYIEVTDEVEIGHNKFYGGSTKITIRYNPIDSRVVDEVSDELLKVIDSLDHSIFIDDDEAPKFYQRYYITNNNFNTNFYDDVATVIYKRLNNLYHLNSIEVIVELNKIKAFYNLSDINFDSIKEMF